MDRYSQWKEFQDAEVQTSSSIYQLKNVKRLFFWRNLEYCLSQYSAAFQNNDVNRIYISGTNRASWYSI